MNKADAINEIIDLQKQTGKVLGCYAIESWRKLDVPMAQLKSLFIIANKPDTNFKMLAQDLGVTSGNVTGIVDRLVEQGLVSRNLDTGDRRVIHLEATEKGLDLLANLMEAQTKHMSHILTHMSLEELTSLSRGLSGLFRSVKDHQREAGDEVNEHNTNV
jgi:DNA-binding MarR family transcriptional regulator